MQPAESNQFAAVNSRQTLQGTDMDIKEIATLTAAEMDDIYLRNVPAIILEQYATRLIAAAQAREAKLRDGIKMISYEIPKTMGEINLRLLKQDLDDLLITTTDDSALKAALKAERERVITFVQDYSDEHGLITTRLITAIRSMT